MNHHDDHRNDRVRNSRTIKFSPWIPREPGSEARVADLLQSLAVELIAAPGVVVFKCKPAAGWRGEKT